MKVHALLALIGLVAVPAFAQEKDALDQQIRQQIDVAEKAFADAFNKNDADAAADHPDAVRPFHINMPEDALARHPNALSSRNSSLLKSAQRSDHCANTSQPMNTIKKSEGINYGRR